MMKTRMLKWATMALALGTGGAAIAAEGEPAPGGLYVGYYQEDARANPEDPTPGAFVLKLPEKDEAFDGAMFFTFVGCQKSNVGKVKGVKAGNTLSGTWAGTIDLSVQTGPYKGSYNPETGIYKGVYSVAGGKQHKKIENCIEYYIGPHGTWEMFGIGKNLPETFKIDVNGRSVKWGAVPGAAMTLVYVLDPSVANAGGGNPVKFQTLLMDQGAAFDMAPLGLAKGKEYVVAALINNARAQRVAFASKKFVAP
jgi:hypothetical protein